MTTRILPCGTPLVQNCWVVDDLDAAMANWLALGVGPFFTLETRYDDAIYRGEIVPLECRVGLAQAGPIQIELIQQTSPGPSAYRDVAPRGGTVFHHMCKITDDYAGDAAALRARGIILANELMSGDIPVCYADTRAEIGCMLELIPPAPLLLDLYALVAGSAKGWDGRDPVRAVPVA